MKFRVTIKDPDVLQDAIEDAVRNEKFPADLDQEELDFMVEHRREKLGEFCSQWVKYGEYFGIEFDTEAGTATVFAVN